MQIRGIADRPGAPGAPARSRRVDRFRLGLLVVWLCTVAAVFATYERPTRVQDLYAAVAAGEVDNVRIVGGTLSPGSDGFSTLDLHWRQGWLPRTATVLQLSPDSEPPARVDSELTHVDPAVELARLDGAVEIDREDRRGGLTLYDGAVPTWLGATVLAVLLAVLLTVVHGPQPWRATRWAWFWLAFSPLGQLGFLLLSGPTPGVSAPRRPQRGLTGGKGFLLSLLLGAVSLPGWGW